MDEKDFVAELREKSLTGTDGRTTRSSSFSAPSLPPPHRQASWSEIMINLWPGAPRHEGRPWYAKWYRLGPLFGIFSMMVAAASLVASLGILAGSDSQKVDDWPAPPATYLAVFTAIANLSMRYASYQGLVIAWWVGALRGTTLSRLNLSWHSGISFRGAITAGRSMGLVGLACIFSTLVAIDGPLLQRASGVHSVPNSDPVSLNITMAPELPHGYSGWWETSSQAGVSEETTTVVFNETVPTVNGSVPNNMWVSLRIALNPYSDGFSRSAPLGGIVQGCPGACTAKIRAPALFPRECKTHTIPANPLIHYDYKSVNEGLFAPPLETFGFFIATHFLVDTTEAIDLITGAATYGADCTGELVYKVCTMEAGIGAYDVEIQNNHILTESLASPTFVDWANNTAVAHANYNATNGGHPSTLAAIDYVATPELQALKMFFAPHEAATAKDGFDYTSYGNNIVDQFAQYNGVSRCPPNFTDPYDFAFNGLNKLMFYMAAGATALNTEAFLLANMDPGVQVRSTVDGYLQGTSNVYHTNYWWFVGAAIVEVVCILFVLPTYWGWWKIGRSVTFSPLEMAKAFESPLLADCNSNSTSRDLAVQSDEMVVRYGHIAADRADGKSKLAFGDSESSTPPLDGTRFDA